jgi:glycosyltransferase involved in cell wall biosynthesis
MTPPLRILLVNSGRRWIGEVGHCALLYEGLKAAGHHVLLACRRGSDLEAYAARRGLNSVSLAFCSRPALSDWRDARLLEERIRNERIELIHTHRGKDHWIGAVVALRSGLPLVRTRHVVTPTRQHVFNRWLYGRATRGLISVSAAAERGLGGLAARPAIREVIPSAVSLESFRPELRSASWRREGLAEDAPEPLWIGLIGRIQRVKGQRVFLEAAGKVAAELPEARFLIAGRKGGAYARGFKRRAREAGFEDRLVVEDMLDDLPTVMASLDIGVVASLGSEGFSRVTVEYMASGVAVVATRVGAIPELLEREGEEALGKVVPPGDAEALAAAMLELGRDGELRRRLGERGVAAARARHRVEDWVEATVDVYRRAMARGR